MAAHDGSHVACLDAAAYFDQFPISDEIGLYFCFIGRDGHTYCLSALAMGQRQSTEVAVMLMRLLCCFPHEGVRIDIATDNVRFVGSYDSVLSAVRMFTSRCSSVGVMLNEISSDPSDGDLEALIVQQADFCGEVIDYSAKKGLGEAQNRRAPR